MAQRQDHIAPVLQDILERAVLSDLGLQQRLMKLQVLMK
jgi:hypothetical protein